MKEQNEEALFRQYLSGELDEAASTALEQRFDKEPSLMERFEAFAEGEVGPQETAMEPIEVPETLAKGVEAKIRTRSRGRFFDDDLFYRTRIPFEAFAAVVMIAIGMVYLLGQAPPEVPALDRAMAGGNGSESPVPPKRPTPKIEPAKRASVHYILRFGSEEAFRKHAEVAKGHASAQVTRKDADNKVVFEMAPSQVEAFLKKLGHGGGKLIRQPGEPSDKATVTLDYLPEKND